MSNEHRTNISVEKKLELIRLMHSESHQNRQKMRGRERIIYDGGGSGTEDLSDSSAEGFSSLKLRFLAALLLFAAFVAWDNGYYPALPINDGRLYSMIEQDMLSANLFAFMEDFTYTLKD